MFEIHKKKWNKRNIKRLLYTHFIREYFIKNGRVVDAFFVKWDDDDISHARAAERTHFLYT